MKRVVLLGFGGPETPEEVRPFLNRIAAGRPIPPGRLEKVVRNYDAIGGRSPFNELTRRQAAALQTELRSRGVDLPVTTAYRFTAPYISEIAARDDGETIAVILAAHQSEASWEKYAELFPRATFSAPLFEHPGFIAAHVDRVRDALRSLGQSSFDSVPLVFTAHSIPVAMAQRSEYTEQLHRSAELIARSAGAPRWHIAYTSRSGSPQEPWLEPDVGDLLRDLAQQGVREVVVDPVGFLCDHVEVLYDLDVAAAAVADEVGIRMSRAVALNDHPAFIGALAEAVQACLA